MEVLRWTSWEFKLLIKFKKGDNMGYQQGGGRGFGGGGGYGGGNKEKHTAICSDCKKECTVPFKPSGDRPVYCKECFAKRKDKSR
jgi:CxxC-x17-CxxC domain-containing protein